MMLTFGDFLPALVECRRQESAGESGLLRALERLSLGSYMEWFSYELPGDLLAPMLT
jgi:hypothetical protein